MTRSLLVAITLFLLGVLAGCEIERINAFADAFNVYYGKRNDGIEDVKARQEMVRKLKASGLCEEAR